MDAASDSQSPGLEPTAHVIRLRGPWQYEPRTALDAMDASQQPASATSGDAAHRTFEAPDGLAAVFVTAAATARGLRLSRFFRRPTGLTAASIIELVIEPIGVPGLVRLNGAVVGPLDSAASRYVITHQLQWGNDLQVDLDRTGDATASAVPGPIDVRLEIR